MTDNMMDLRTLVENVLAHALQERAPCRLGLHRNRPRTETPEAASAQWHAVADQVHPKVPKLAAIMDEAEHTVLA